MRSLATITQRHQLRLYALYQASLLLGHAGRVAAVAARGLRVLTAAADVPVVAEASVQAHTLHPLDVLAERLVKEIGVFLPGLAVLHAAATIEHPGRDLELQRVADDGHHLIDLVGAHFSCAFFEVDIAFLADDV